MQSNLDKYARERRGTTVSAGVSVDLETDIHFRRKDTTDHRQFYAGC